MTDHQQAAIEAAAEAMATDWNPDRDPVLTAIFRDYSVSAIAAAEPHLRKKVRAEVAAEIRASLPRDLAASAQDLDGWFSGMTGDLNHLAAIAARIAEGVDHAGTSSL